MAIIKPISYLRNYTEILREVTVGKPVFLMKNGKVRYALVDINEYEKSQAILRLMSKLAKGEHSGDEEGWLALGDVEKALGIDNN